MLRRPPCKNIVFVTSKMSVEILLYMKESKDIHRRLGYFLLR